LLSPIHLSDPPAPIVKAALEKRVSLSFEDVPLAKVVEQLAPMLGGNIWISSGLQDDDGKPIEPPTITYRCEQMLLIDALESMLAPTGLRCRIADEGLEISDLATCQKVNEWRIYPILDLVGRARNDDIQLLMEIQETIDRDAWLPNGGDGQIIIYPEGFFIVGCSAETLRQISKFFAVKRLSLPLDAKTRAIGVLGVGEEPPNVDGQAVCLEPREYFLRGLKPKLRDRHDIDIHEATIEDAVRRIGRTIGASIALDVESIRKEPMLTKARVAIRRKGIQARTVLNSLRSYGLRVNESQEGITVESDYEESKHRIRHSWRAYPIADLIAGRPRDWTGKKIGKEMDPVFVLTNLVCDFGDNQIACFDDPPELVVVDLPLLTCQLHRIPRREHLRHEQLFAGIRESIRRRAEIISLISPPKPDSKDH
jgi:hypothetical protein